MNMDVLGCVQFRPSSDNDTQHFTTNTGMPVWNNVSSMTVGQRGPVLLEGKLLLTPVVPVQIEKF